MSILLLLQMLVSLFLVFCWFFTCNITLTGFTLEWQAYSIGQLAHTLAIWLVNLSDDRSIKKIGWLARKVQTLKRKIMEAMFMNGKEKHDVFDWSDIVSVSQSEFVKFCATNCELPPLKQQTLFVGFLNRMNAFVTSVSFFLCCAISLEE